jgi:hypothetical protein
MKLVATTEKVTIKWFVYVNGGPKISKESWMTGKFYGYDAECSCGWGTHWGGGIYTGIQEAVWRHKWLDHDYEIVTTYSSTLQALLEKAGHNV